MGKNRQENEKFSNTKDHARKFIKQTRRKKQLSDFMKDEYGFYDDFDDSQYD